MTQTLGLQSPWYTLYNKIVSMFGGDEELTISNITETTKAAENAKATYTITISSANAVKLQAIEKILKHEFPMGNIVVKIAFVYEESKNSDITAADFKNAFTGNPIMSNIKTIETPWKSEMTFVLFKREVIQFYNDDITDLYGNFNGLAEDIARELFNDVTEVISYCTDIIPAND
jgi:hypothetical protein